MDKAAQDLRARGIRTMVSVRLRALAFVHDYIGQWRNSPSLGEIAAAIGTDRTMAHRAVKSLVASGLLNKTPGVRGISLPDQEQEALRILARAGWAISPDGSKAERAQAPGMR
jgi:DNA-binding MarR family transcriptional regulator